jgi:hypothetical protein
LVNSRTSIIASLPVRLGRTLRGRTRGRRHPVELSVA